MKHFFKKTACALMAALSIAALAGAPLCSVEAAAKYTVSVNVTANVITVYENGEPIRSMTCSTGEDTPRSGTRTLREKYRWKNLYHNSYGQYCTRYDDHMLFHSVPYMREGDNSSLSGGLFDRLGTPDSMGCIRMLCGDAKWFYDTVPTGTKVSFYCDSENPGPLGWPYCSSRRDVSMKGGFDPTDPADNNDWNRYYQSAFDADYYLANNPDLLEIDKHWTETTLKLHWVMEGMYEGRQASPHFNVNTYKSQHPELVPYYGDTNFMYIIQYNKNVAEGINVPETIAKAEAGEQISKTTQAADGSVIQMTALADGSTYRLVTAPDGTVTASLTSQAANGNVTTSPMKVDEKAAAVAADAAAQAGTSTAQAGTATAQTGTAATQVAGTTTPAAGAGAHIEPSPAPLPGAPGLGAVPADGTQAGTAATQAGTVAPAQTAPAAASAPAASSQDVMVVR